MIRVSEIVFPGSNRDRGAKAARLLLTCISLAVPCFPMMAQEYHNGTRRLTCDTVATRKGFAGPLFKTEGSFTVEIKYTVEIVDGWAGIDPKAEAKWRVVHIDKTHAASFASLWKTRCAAVCVAYVGLVHPVDYFVVAATRSPNMQEKLEATYAGRPIAVSEYIFPGYSKFTVLNVPNGAESGSCRP